MLSMSSAAHILGACPGVKCFASSEQLEHAATRKYSVFGKGFPGCFQEVRLPRASQGPGEGTTIILFLKINIYKNAFIIIIIRAACRLVGSGNAVKTPTHLPESSDVAHSPLSRTSSPRSETSLADGFPASRIGLCALGQGAVVPPFVTGGRSKDLVGNSAVTHNTFFSDGWCPETGTNTPARNERTTTSHHITSHHQCALQMHGVTSIFGVR